MPGSHRAQLKSVHPDQCRSAWPSRPATKIMKRIGAFSMTAREA